HRGAPARASRCRDARQARGGVPLMDLSAYLDLFVAEAREHLGAAYGLASRSEEGPASEAALRELFRHLHSVKGMAASMGFGAMSGLAHDAESLMERLRTGQMSPRASTRRLLCE